MVLVKADPLAETAQQDARSEALTLNAPGRAIWELCDGDRSANQIVDILAHRFAVDRPELTAAVERSLAELSHLGFIEGIHPDAFEGPAMTFVIGVEDRPYFWWQTAIFLESLRGKLPSGWRPLVVVCNNEAELSTDLKQILEHFRADYALARNHANSYRLDIGKDGGQHHAAMNRIEALSVAGEHVPSTDLICLLDSDIFLYRELNLGVLPKRCAASRNWHMEEPKFFSTVAKNQGNGINLTMLLRAIGCEHEFLPGGVNVFVTGSVAKDPKFIADCYRFAHSLFLLAHTAGAEIAWMAEMPCFALAMTANGIEYELLKDKELLVSDCSEATIPPGTFYHYYSDPSEFGRFAFKDSSWHKHAYKDENFLRADLEPFRRRATTDHERYFFELAARAQARIET